MILVFSFLTVVMILSAAIFAKTTHFLQVESRSAIADQAINLAEAGVDYAMWALNADPGWYGEADPLPIGGGEVEIEFDSTTNVITSTAYIPNISAPRVKRAIQIQAQISPGGNAVFDYATYADSTAADAVMLTRASSQIWGNVISNGGIKHGEADYMGNPTGRICGSAWAKGSITLLAANFYQNPGPPSCTGNPYPGGQYANYTPWPSDIWKLPDFPFAIIRASNMNELITCAGAGECTINATDYNDGCAPDPSWGTCLDNRRLKGNFRFCGNFYIKDKIHINKDSPDHGHLYKISSCNAQFRPAANTGLTYFLVDGTAKFSSNVFQKNGQGFIWLATDHTDTFIEKAIEIRSSPIMPGAVFQANAGTVLLFNNTNVASVYAKKILIFDTSILKYDLGLAAQGCPGGDCSAPASWTIKRGTYQYIDPN